MVAALLASMGCQRPCPECQECPQCPERPPAAGYQEVEGDDFTAVLPPSFESELTSEDAKRRARQIVALVKLGYGDSFELLTRSLSFRTEPLSTREAQLVVSLVRSYNAWDGAKVAEVLARFEGRVESWEFGREGSPVLYMNLPFHTKVHTKVPAEVHRKTVDDLRRALVDELHADEFGPVYEELGDHSLRAWWD